MIGDGYRKTQVNGHEDDGARRSGEASAAVQMATVQQQLSQQMAAMQQIPAMQQQLRAQCEIQQQRRHIQL